VETGPDRWEKGRLRQKGRKVSATFCEQKVAKKLYESGLWAMSATTPITQHNKSFCGAFFKKRLLSF
jgi:hypothetical protein